MTIDIRMAEHLCTRLCHDLTGPIGAVNNGAEFLADQGFDMQPEAIELIATSAREAVNRLQFYRLAYGKLNEHGEASLQEKKQITAAYFTGTKVMLDWPDEHTDAAGVPVSQKMSRLILNMVIVASRTLIRGGMVSVRLLTGEGGKRIVTVQGAGDSIKDDAEVSRILLGDRVTQLSPKTVQGYLTRGLADEMGVELAVSVGEGSYVITATRFNAGE